MENASKALLMAGGVLIALLIIGLLIYSFGTMSGYFETENTKEQAEQLKAFNDQYEAYNRKLLRGTDVVSVINKVIDNNEKYGINGYNEPNYIIQVEFELIDSVGNLEAGRIYNISNYSEMKKNQEDFTDFKRRIFNCKEIKYNKSTGRVNYISFIERKSTE
ncbi:MAG: hypothetical protein J6A04_02520 [Clostridia bacterium]|nr:hypothetical protein [Clostridia bacterium]